MEHAAPPLKHNTISKSEILIRISVHNEIQVSFIQQNKTVEWNGGILPRASIISYAELADQSILKVSKKKRLQERADGEQQQPLPSRAESRMVVAAQATLVHLTAKNIFAMDVLILFLLLQMP